MKIKQLSTDNFIARFLAWLTGMVVRHRWLFLYGQVVLFALSILITVKYPGIQFNTSRNDLVGSNKKYHQNFLRFKDEFPTQDDLVVVVESENTERNRQFVERLGAKLEAETNLFHDVFYKGDLKMLGSKALLFVPDKDLAELHQQLKDFRPFIGADHYPGHRQLAPPGRPAFAGNHRAVRSQRGGGSAGLYHVRQRARLPGDGAGADRGQERRRGGEDAAVGGGNEGGGAGS